MAAYRIHEADNSCICNDHRLLSVLARWKSLAIVSKHITRSQAGQRPVETGSDRNRVSPICTGKSTPGTRRVRGQAPAARISKEAITHAALRSKMKERLERWSVALKTLPVAEVVVFLLRRLMEALRLTRGQYQMKSTDARFPLWCRAGSSDLAVFSQIFVHREYRCLDSLTEVGVVIDCGDECRVLVGVLFCRVPNCTVIAVEPDPGNFAALKRNLEPYGDRVRAIQSGIWGEQIGLVMNEAVFRDGREWARQVRPALAGEMATMEAIDIGSLVESCGGERTSILKIDIEGAEYEVFSSPGWRRWIDRVDTLVIEVHGPDAYRATIAVFEEAGFDFQWWDELIVARRPG